MRVKPSNSAAADLVVPDELDHFSVCHRGRLAHRFVQGKKLCSSSAVTDQQLAVNEIVAEHFIVGEKAVEVARVRFCSSEETDPDRCIDKNHLCTAALSHRFFSTPRDVACRGIGATQSAKTLMGGMADKCLEPHPYGFGVCGGTAHGARLVEQLFVNVERLLHTDDLAISFHPKQPDGRLIDRCRFSVAQAWPASKKLSKNL
jgi:hypothetical protein